MRQSASFFNRSRIMTSLPANASPLRQRMIDDMRMRQLAPRTQDIYLHIVREFARFLGRSPDTATVEDLRRYQPRDHRPEVLLHSHARPARTDGQDATGARAPHIARRTRGHFAATMAPLHRFITASAPIKHPARPPRIRHR
jgi:hypothetical protein